MHRMDSAELKNGWLPWWASLPLRDSKMRDVITTRSLRRSRRKQKAFRTPLLQGKTEGMPKTAHQPAKVFFPLVLLRSQPGWSSKNTPGCFSAPQVKLQANFSQDCTFLVYGAVPAFAKASFRILVQCPSLERWNNLKK